MVCSFCKRDGHRRNKCPEMLRDFDEEDLLHIPFAEFVKNVLIFSLTSYNLPLIKKYEYLFNTYVVKHKYDARKKENKDVLKVIVCESDSYRNSIDSNVDEDTINHTFFIILPSQYNKSEIVLNNVKNNFEYEESSMMTSKDITIENLFWI
jgi:hypothetical protein